MDKYKNPTNPLYKRSSFVDGYTFPFPLMDNKTFAVESGYKGIRLLKYWLRIWFNFYLANQKLKETLKKKICYYGPFKGEFGHFTAHNLPFLMYLHHHGVKIIYCGMDLHKPFMIDDTGKSIVHEFRSLRDFFKEVAPDCNHAVPPKDVQLEIEKFHLEATNSRLPFWNINDPYYYWFIHRNWLLENHTHVYNIDKFYKTKTENTCCIFPRSIGPPESHNHGKAWDYIKIIDSIAPYYDKIYICGHPTQVKDLNVTNPKVEIAVGTDNSKMLEKTANSNLIITQHSGINNVGEYVNTQVLIIYNGGKAVTDIGSMNDTLRFRNSLGNNLPLAFAFSENDIVNFVKTHTEKYR